MAGCEMVPAVLPLSLLQETGADKDDIVSIATSGYEQQLLRLEKQFEEQVQAATEDNVKKSKAVDTAKCEARKDAVKLGSKEAKKMVAALAKAGFANFSTRGRYDAEGVSVECNDDKEITVNVTVYQHDKDSASDSGHVFRSFKTPWPSGVAEAIGAYKKSNEALRELKISMLKVKERLAKINTIERVAKAELAKTKLEQTEGGRLILERMEQVSSQRFNELEHDVKKS